MTSVESFGCPEVLVVFPQNKWSFQPVVPLLVHQLNYQQLLLIVSIVMLSWTQSLLKEATEVQMVILGVVLRKHCPQPKI